MESKQDKDATPGDVTDLHDRPEEKEGEQKETTPE